MLHVVLRHENTREQAVHWDRKLCCSGWYHLNLWSYMTYQIKFLLIVCVESLCLLVCLILSAILFHSWVLRTLFFQPKHVGNVLYLAYTSFVCECCTLCSALVAWLSFRAAGNKHVSAAVWGSWRRSCGGSFCCCALGERLAPFTSSSFSDKQAEGNWHKRPSSLVGWSLHINSFLCTLSFWTSDMEVFSWFCLSKPL